MLQNASTIVRKMQASQDQGGQVRCRLDSRRQDPTNLIDKCLGLDLPDTAQEKLKARNDLQSLLRLQGHSRAHLPHH
jgi:hypothetical protein